MKEIKQFSLTTQAFLLFFGFFLSSGRAMSSNEIENKKTENKLHFQLVFKKLSFFCFCLIHFLTFFFVPHFPHSFYLLNVFFICSNSSNIFKIALYISFSATQNKKKSYNFFCNLLQRMRTNMILNLGMEIECFLFFFKGPH